MKDKLELRMVIHNTPAALLALNGTLLKVTFEVEAADNLALEANS